ncbi:class I SAM-dependent methyltransferase [uncultured Thiodictyon sp.]|uniref:class I SAM-dependent methyltransferase n=1 Tax=uncultured Thiodictyon sp. TaxID=1846217 RepID=UPI0025E868C5|nr:class I SAM-dependent methyltransferase [uncultured Thiodictyon sp.]
MQKNNLTRAERACPVCGGRSYRPFAEERIDPLKISNFTYASRKSPEFMCLRLVRCTECDLVYAPTPPTTDVLSAVYAGAGYDSAPEAQAAARSYARALTPYVARLAGRNAAVDVGAGSGPLLPWLGECGFRPVIGVEPSRAAIAAAAESVRPMLREGMFSPALLPDVTVSLICSFMTLEHLESPGDFVRTAYGLLEPGGMLALVVHNWRAPLNRVLGLRSPIIDVEHLQLFSPRSLRTLLVQSGLTSIAVQGLTNAYPLRYWLRLAPLPSGFKERAHRLLDKLGLSYTEMPFRVGNMLVTAVKPATRGR